MNAEPSQIIIGDTVTWIRRQVQAISVNDSGSPTYINIKASEGWALKWTSVGKLGVMTISAIADDINPDDFKFVIPAATSAAYVAGDYQWQIVATKTTTRYTIAEGIVSLLDNISARTALYDNRSHAKKVLDAIEAVIEGRATQDQMAYQIAGRSLSRTSIPDLLLLRSRYQTEYRDEVNMANIAAGLGTGRKIYARFK